MMMHLAQARLAAALLLLVVLAASPGRAADAESKAQDLTELSLEQLMNIEVESVYGASRYLQKVTDAPSAVSVITADEIRLHGYRTLAEALRGVRGMYATSDRNYEYLGLRGFGRVDDYNARILVLVDGHRSNDNLYESALVGTDFPIDIEMIDRIEVIRGPGSAVYGTNALFGVINVVTRSGRESEGVQATGDLAGLGTRSGHASLGLRTPADGRLLISGSLYSSDGEESVFIPEFASPATGGGYARNSDADRAGRLFARATLGDVTLEGAFGSRRKTVPTASWGTVFGDARNQSLDQRGWVDLSFHHALRDRTELSGRASLDLYDYSGDYPTDYGSSPDTPFVVVNRDEDRGRWWTAEVSARRPIVLRQTLLVGTEVRDNFQQTQRNYDQNPYTLYLDDHRSSRSWAGYAEDDIALHPRVRLNVGVRTDRYPVFGTSTNPRVGLFYTPDRRTTIKLLYGSAFRIPTIYELYFGGDGYTPNPDLRPETIRTGELVIESYFTRHYRATGSVFEYRVDDLITERPNAEDGALQFHNGQDVTSRGFDAELAGAWRSGYGCRVSYSHQVTNDQATGRRLVNSPDHLAQLSASAPLVGKRVMAGLDLQYMSHRRTLAGAETPAHVLTNVSLSASDRSRRLSVTGDAFDLFDVRYSDPASTEHVEDTIPQVGRTFRVTARVRF